MTNNQNPNSHLTIILWNANGLKQNKNEFQYLLQDKNIDIALVTETHLSPSVKLNFPVVL